MRAIAFGWLALLRGVALLVAGGLLGAVYDVSPGYTMALIVVANIAAVAGLVPVLRRIQPATGP